MLTGLSKYGLLQCFLSEPKNKYPVRSRGIVMKLKYQIIKDDEKKTVILREYAELDKEILSPLCEESYEIKAVKAAIAEGKEALIAALRTKNMYPPGIYAGKIAATMTELLKSKDEQSTELFFNDIELLAPEVEDNDIEAELSAESEAIDELLEDDYNEEEIEEKGAIKKINSSLKIADDESGDVDDDVWPGSYMVMEGLIYIWPDIIN